ncbi:MAG TPA: PDZ domain-containing protein [Polyangia bacterium]|nr:PDZ domain-containing protein [Polyangia bacterium]
MLPVAICSVVLLAVAILVRASFDTDEPGQDRSASGWARRRAPEAQASGKPGQAVGSPASATGQSPVRPGAAPAVGMAARLEPPRAGSSGLEPALGGPATALAPGAPAGGAGRPGAPLFPGGGARAAGGPVRAGNLPGPRTALRGSALVAAKDAPRNGGAAGHAGTSAGAGAGGAGGGRVTETKVALAGDPAKRDALWRRPLSEEDASSKLVARFAPSGGATLRGRVVDAESGRPSSGVTIEAHIGDAFMRTISDSAGAFKMSGVLPGRKITIWIIGRSDTFVAERIDLTSPGEGETTDAGVVRLLRGDELAAHLEGWMGMFVSRRGRRNVVAAVSPWSPADRAGIQVGDVLLSIEGRDVDGLGPRATGFLLRGPVGTKANVAVQSRDGGGVLRYQLERVLR